MTQSCMDTVGPSGSVETKSSFYEGIVELVKKYDKINKPDHYHIWVQPSGGYPYPVEIDCLAVVEALGFDKKHYLASALAYLWRCQKKGSYLSDLKKAVFYLNREIDTHERNGISE